MGELPYWTDIIENGLPFVFHYFMVLGLGLLAGVVIILLADFFQYPKWLVRPKKD